MLFHYFGSKRDLYLCLVDYSIDYVETEFLARVVPAKEALVERLQRIAKAEIEAIAATHMCSGFWPLCILTTQPVCLVIKAARGDAARMVGQDLWRCRYLYLS